MIILPVVGIATLAFTNLCARIPFNTIELYVLYIWHIILLYFSGMSHSVNDFDFKKSEEK